MARAISNKNVLQAKFDVADFDGAFLASFGRPELRGEWLIYGGSGCGKTTFVMQLCKYLTRFRRVAYNSLEQGLSLSLQKAWERVGMEEVGTRIILLDKESLKKAHDVVLEKFGPCEVLINGAGGNNPKGTTTSEYFSKEDMLDENARSFFDLDQDGVSFVFNLNFLGTLLTTQAFATDMLETGGCIVNISSMNAFTPLTKIPAYSGAKAAVSNFTQWLAVHFANCNIRVNAIAPGFFATNQNRALLFNEDGSLTPRSHKIISQTPMGRFGEPEELLGTLRFLIDNDASGFVTGITIPVDGGFSAYSGV